MNKRRICFFNTTQAWGGGEKWHAEIAQWMVGKIDLTMSITNLNSELYKQINKTDIKNISLPIKKFSFLNPIKVLQIAKIFKQNSIDTVIMNLSSDMKIAGLAAKKAKVKHIIYRRGSAIPVKNSFINRYFFKNIITGIIANSEETKKTILQNNKYLFDANKIKVIYNGINIKKFDQLKITQTFNNPNNTCIIGNAGRLEKQKNQASLIQIAKLLAQKNLNFKIRIAGTGTLKEKLNELAIKNNVSEHIEFVGFVESIKNFTESIDIFVLTSFWEGFGYVLAEAMLSSKPIVAFAVSSNPEIVAHNETGFLIENLCEKEMAEKIEILINDKNLREEFGKKGRVRAENLFDIEQTYQNVNNYLLNLNK